MYRILSCIISICFLSCSDSIEPQPDSIGYHYFPLELGSYRTYDVTEINYALLNEVDTVHYKLREQVVDTFSTQNEMNYILHRSTRLTDQETWELDSVWTARRTENHAITVENNVPFVKIVFPITLNKIWDGNLFNALPKDEYEIEDIGGSMQTPADNFVNLLTVYENNDPDTLIFQDIRQSVYAPEVGLIYEMSSILNFCNTDPSCLGTLESGIQSEQILTSYGKE